MVQRRKAMLVGPAHSRAALVKGKLAPHNVTVASAIR